MRRLALPLLTAAAMTAAAAPSFRFSRPVEAPAGWSQLELPDDVLDACRPGLPDLRLRGASGEDVPYAFAEEAGGASTRWELTNVESTAKRETVALLDRGRNPPLAQSVTFEVTAEEFLKPVVLEASDDGSIFREVAAGSLFAASGVRSTTLRFAGNDRPYWRFRFDDRNGDAIRPVAVRVEAASVSAAAREIPLRVSLPESDGSTALTARLPAANLAVTALRLDVEEPAYERRVRVFERIFFRDEVSRRLVGDGTIRRSPDSAARTQVAIGDLAGRSLEIEMENGDSPPLHVLGLTALAAPRRLLFFSANTGPLHLLYGSPSGPAPRYDLGSALRQGRPKALGAATLGPASQIAQPPALAAPPRGAPLETTAWRRRQAIQTPSSGSVAYLDIREPGQLASLRILDGENRPVPYVIEQSTRHLTRSVFPPRVTQEGSRTIVVVGDLDASSPADGLALFASAPDYFSREVTVVEEERDARGATGDRVLGSAHWERRPGEPASPLTISLAPPRAKSLRAEIENGDNAPLKIDRVDVKTPFVRIDFVYTPGETLSLLSDNPQASFPRYDFAMIADRVLASPASPGRLGPVQRPREKTPVPRWFWGATALAAVLVLLALSRTLRSQAE
jgi:hypothetical protein